MYPTKQIRKQARTAESGWSFTVKAGKTHREPIPKGKYLRLTSVFLDVNEDRKSEKEDRVMLYYKPGIEGEKLPIAALFTHGKQQMNCRHTFTENYTVDGKLLHLDFVEFSHDSDLHSVSFHGTTHSQGYSMFK